MASSIDSQTWTIIQEIERSQQRDTKHQKLGSERIAEENSSTKTLSDQQQIAKDVVLPAEQQAGRMPLTSNQTAAKPPLLPPDINWDALQGVGPIEPGLISIIGAALILQAKTNSNFWSTMWKQASESMQIEVKFAPIIGKAIYNSYDAQSKATQSQSDQAAEEGKIGIGMFCASVVLSGISEFTDEDNPMNTKKSDVAKQDENAPTDEDKPGQDDNLDDTGGGSSRSQNATEKIDTTTNKEIEKQTDSYYTRAKKYWKEKIGPKLERGQKRFTSWLGRGIQTSTAMQMSSEGFTKYFVTSKYQAQQAVYQGQEGGSQALSKESEQYAQFFGQDFSRTEDIRQGAGQNLDYAMNLLKSASDTVTQTVTSMFRG